MCNINGYFNEAYNLSERTGWWVSFFKKKYISYIIRNDITLTDSFDRLAIEVYKDFDINKNIIIIIIAKSFNIDNDRKSSKSCFLHGGIRFKYK